MKIYETANYKQMSQFAADIIMQDVKYNKNMVMGLATGSSPLGIYEKLATYCKEGQLSLKNVKGFNLDEYVGLDRFDSQSFYYYLNKNLVECTDFSPNHLFVLNGKTDNIEQECLSFEEKIAKAGGIDLQLLGIGGDGHIGFNEPAATFPNQTHVVQLEKETIETNARFFPSMEAVPTKAYTMGIGTIMKAKKIVMVVSGSAKANILYKMVMEDVTPMIPASILQYHNNCIIIADTEAVQKLKETNNGKILEQV